jgi:flap endonuclease-1
MCVSNFVLPTGFDLNYLLSDGTLITQRLHFSQGYGAYRHVLGWYRIAKELNDNGVSAICVFDGKNRNIAKAREVCSNFINGNNFN